MNKDGDLYPYPIQPSYPKGNIMSIKLIAVAGILVTGAVACAIEYKNGKARLQTEKVRTAKAVAELEEVLKNMDPKKAEEIRRRAGL